MAIELNVMRIIKSAFSRKRDKPKLELHEMPKSPPKLREADVEALLDRASKQSLGSKRKLTTK